MSTEEEPPTKKVKTGWENHTLNCSEALMKADEGMHFTDLVEADVSVLQGIGPMSAKVLEVMKIKTVKDLATYKFFLVARALATLAETEKEGDRPEGSAMNVDKAVDKEYETKSLKEIVSAPIGALEGLTDASGDLLKDLGVKTIGDLATLKYFRWAEAIVQMAEFENTMTEAERKKDRELKKLA